MSATTIFAKLFSSDKIIHIDDADKNKQHQFFCPDCNKELIVVKSDARKRDWHYRHFEGIICSGSRSDALHTFAKQILMDNRQLKISKELTLNYTDPRKEATFLDYRSDVAFLYQGEIIHNEIYVTNDLTEKKIQAYEENKIKCIKIDLSDPKFLKATKEEIEYEVLYNCQNRRLIGWESETKPIPASQWTFVDYILAGIAALVALAFAFWIIEEILGFFFGRRKTVRLS